MQLPPAIADELVVLGVRRQLAEPFDQRSVRVQFQHPAGDLEALHVGRQHLLQLAAHGPLLVDEAAGALGQPVRLAHVGDQRVERSAEQFDHAGEAGRGGGAGRFVRGLRRLGELHIGRVDRDERLPLVGPQLGEGELIDRVVEEQHFQFPPTERLEVRMPVEAVERRPGEVVDLLLPGDRAADVVVERAGAAFGPVVGQAQPGPQRVGRVEPHQPGDPFAVLEILPHPGSQDRAELGGELGELLG